MGRMWKPFLFGCAFMVVAACQGGGAEAPKGEGAPEAQSKTPAAAQQGAEQPATEAPAAPEGANISGVVVETMDSGGYTYVCIDKGGGEKVWAAMPQTHVEVGKQMTLGPGSQMSNFRSNTLNRTFEEIIFCGGPLGAVAEGPKEAPSGAPGEDLSAGQIKSFGGGRVAVPAASVKVEKATGEDAYTVSEIYEKKAGLEGKKVLVKGSVVKVSPGILGRNWVHVQDGTGDASKGTHDLVVTTQDLPSVGDVVTASGTFHAGRDFGYGYTYEAIVEEGTLTK